MDGLAGLGTGRGKDRDREEGQGRHGWGEALRNTEQVGACGSWSRITGESAVQVRHWESPEQEVMGHRSGPGPST